jgi:hypothetical protein
LFWHYPLYSNQVGCDASALRLVNYKLIENLKSAELILFNLVKDPSEKNNLAKNEKLETLNYSLY